MVFARSPGLGDRRFGVPNFDWTMLHIWLPVTFA
jgi:hypothetical protein